MEDKLSEYIHNQRQKTINNFKNMSAKYIPTIKRDLWNKYLDNYYLDQDNREVAIQDIFNYITGLSEKYQVPSKAQSFINRIRAFSNASVVAKTIAFFAFEGEEFYNELRTLAEENNIEDLIDESFATKLAEVKNCDDIDESLALFKVKSLRINLGDNEDIQTIIFEDGFINGLTPDQRPVIGQKIENQYVFYIINKDSTYERFLIKDPNIKSINKNRQTIWGFITNEKGEFVGKMEKAPEIIEIDDSLTLAELHERDNVAQYLDDDSIILPIMREIYEFGLPINENSETTNIKAIMFKEMQKSLKLTEK